VPVVPFLHFVLIAVALWLSRQKWITVVVMLVVWLCGVGIQVLWMQGHNYNQEAARALWGGPTHALMGIVACFHAWCTRHPIDEP